ncbi:MAG: 4Fe-4S binding protein, partial [Gammaproteobacteria bacterium]|nr:4Fe-4S binding protein [Gammaproteobacteria bacterium]
ALPWLLPKKDGAKAVVDLEHCNGCGLCFEDCPFDAITVQARTDGARYEHEVVVNPSCAAPVGFARVPARRRTRFARRAKRSRPASTCRSYQSMKCAA